MPDTAETDVSVITLPSRRLYAVLHLRDRLRDVYDELTKARGLEDMRPEAMKTSTPVEWMVSGVQATAP